MKILDVSSFEKLKINPMSLNDFNNIEIKTNKYGITKNNLTGDIADFPVGVVVKMLEEMEKQKDARVINIENIMDIDEALNILIDSPRNGFIWNKTKDGQSFWSDVIHYHDFDKFFEKYPEYKKYN